jgi:hypothetical protein
MAVLEAQTQIILWLAAGVGHRRLGNPHHLQVLPVLVGQVLLQASRVLALHGLVVAVEVFTQKFLVGHQERQALVALGVAVLAVRLRLELVVTVLLVQQTLGVAVAEHQSQTLLLKTVVLVALAWLSLKSPIPVLQPFQVV